MDEKMSSEIFLKELQNKNDALERKMLSPEFSQKELENKNDELERKMLSPEFSQEELENKNDELERKIEDNNEALRYWKGLNKKHVLEMRAYRKEIQALTKTNDIKYQSLTKDLEDKKSKIHDLTVKLQQADGLLERVSIHIQQKEEESTTERERRSKEFKMKENKLNSKILELESVSRKQSDQIEALEDKIKLLDGINDKFTKLEEDFGAKEKALAEICRTNGDLQTKVGAAENKLQQIQKELLEKDEEMKNKEKFWEEEILRVKEANKLGNRKFFQRKSKSVKNEEKVSKKEGCMARMSRFFRRKRHDSNDEFDSIGDIVVDGVPSTSSNL